jgi:hypothetical protein
MDRYNFIIIKFLLLVFISLSLPAFFRFDYENKKNYMAELQQEIEKIQPDFIFLGNSMLNSRIDPNYFNKLTNSKSYTIWEGGVTSSVWYLILKNVISTANVKPKAVFIFFRDTYLTEAKYRTDGAYEKYINMYSQDNEPVLQSIIATETSLRTQYYTFVKTIYPILDKNDKIKHKLSDFAEWLTNSLNSKIEFKKSDVNKILSLENFRNVNNDGENVNESGYKWNYDFSKALQQSFLPHIIDIGKNNNLLLAFVRIKKRPLLNGLPSQNPDLELYIEELKKYLESNNCKFFDFTGDKRITIDMYGSGDHIDESSKTLYTEIFSDTIKGML